MLAHTHTHTFHPHFDTLAHSHIQINYAAFDQREQTLSEGYNKNFVQIYPHSNFISTFLNRPVIDGPSTRFEKGLNSGGELQHYKVKGPQH